MKRYLVTLNIVTNGCKINTIKDLRGATGAGLVVCKNFVETSYKPAVFTDSVGGDMIVNAEQLANLLILSLREPERSDWDGRVISGTFTLDKVVEVGQSAVDVSTLIALEA